MRISRDWPLGLGLVLCAASLFLGGAAQSGPLTWLGGGALLLALMLLAVRGAPAGAVRLVPLAGLAAWSALSIRWSTLPDASWDYADRALVYLLLALVGLWFAGRTRELAAGLAVLLGAVVFWALLGKVVPTLPGDYQSPLARLRGPVGLWNQLALLGAFALPLALWAATRLRVPGTLLAYGWLVALLLTYSRGGLAVAVLVVAAWLACSDRRADGLATLVAAALPAGAVVGLAFALPGVTSDGQSSHVRWHDGLVLGGALVVGAAVAAALTRLPRPRARPGLRRLALGVAAVAVLAAVAVALLKAGSAWRSFTSSAEVGNGGNRLGSAGSNLRWTWWQQAWRGFTHHVLHGTGAGSFRLTNLLYRRSSADTVTEPHDLPLQFLSETGVVGALLLAGSVAALLQGSVRRFASRRGGPELALALILPAFLLHSLVDVDWDYVAVAAPAFLAAGVLAGRAGAERRVSGFAVLAGLGVALALFGALLLPWLGHRWAGQALTDVTSGRPAPAAQMARRARAVDPLLVDPLYTLALAAEEQGHVPRAYAFYVEATRKQPANPDTWRAAGLFAWSQNCPRATYDNLVHATGLDPYADPQEGGGAIYNKALAIVNAGKAAC